MAACASNGPGAIRYRTRELRNGLFEREGPIPRDQPPEECSQHTSGALTCGGAIRDELPSTITQRSGAERPFPSSLTQTPENSLFVIYVHIFYVHNIYP